MELQAFVAGIVDDAGLDTDLYDVRVAVLDADPQQTSELAFALACIGPTQSGYLIPYGNMPEGIDTYRIGIWDDAAGRFVSGAITGEANITEDGISVYIQNRATLASVFDMMRRAASGSLMQGQGLSAGIWASASDDPGLWSDFDPTGLDDALSYLRCF